MKGQRIIPHGGEAGGDVLVMVQLLSGDDADHDHVATDVPDLAESFSPVLWSAIRIFTLHPALTILFTLITFPTPCQMCTRPVTEGSNLSKQTGLGLPCSSGSSSSCRQAPQRCSAASPRAPPHPSTPPYCSDRVRLSLPLVVLRPPFPCPFFSELCLRICKGICCPTESRTSLEILVAPLCRFSPAAVRSFLADPPDASPDREKIRQRRRWHASSPLPTHGRR